MTPIQHSNTQVDSASLPSNKSMVNNLQYSTVLLPFSPWISTSSASLLFVLFQRSQKVTASSAFLGGKRHMAFCLELWWKLLSTLPTKVLKVLSSVCVSLSSVLSLNGKSISTKASCWTMHKICEANPRQHLLGKWLQAKALRWIQVNGRLCTRATLAFIWCSPVPEAKSGKYVSSQQGK